MDIIDMILHFGAMLGTAAETTDRVAVEAISKGKNKKSCLNYSLQLAAKNKKREVLFVLHYKLYTPASYVFREFFSIQVQSQLYTRYNTL